MTLSREQIADYRRHLDRLRAFRDPLITREDLSALLDIAEAVANAPVETMHHLGGGTLAAELVLPDVWTALDGNRVALVVLPLAGEVAK